MTDLYTSNYPSSGYGSESVIRTEFGKIEEAFNKVVPKVPGATAPQLTADIDLNNNDLLNVGSIDVQSISVDNTSILELLEQYSGDIISEAEASATAAENAKDAAESARDQTISYLDDVASLHEEVEAFQSTTEAVRDEVVLSVAEFDKKWLGTLASDPDYPEADVGSIYYNGNENVIRVCYASSSLGGVVQQLYWRPASVDDSTLGTAAYFNTTTTINDYLSICQVNSKQVNSNQGISGVSVSPDGTKILLLYSDGGTNLLKMYEMSTPFDISTMSSFSSSDVSIPTKFYTSSEMTPDGTSVFLTGKPTFNGVNVVDRYVMSTPWDLSTIDPDSPIRKDNFSSSGNNLLSCSFSGDGLYFSVMGSLGTEVLYLSTPYDLTSMTYGTVDASSPPVANKEGIVISSDNSMVTICDGPTIVSTRNSNNQGIPYNIDKISYTLPTGSSFNTRDLCVSSNGKWMYVVAETTGIGDAQLIVQISLSRLAPY